MSFRKALLYAFSTRYAALGLQFLSTIILARLLTPTEVGVYSVTAALVMIAQTLRDFGTSTYVIQEQELTKARLATASTITLLFALLLAALVWLLAIPLAAFYREPGVADLLQVLALNFALIPFGSISLSLLRRDMNFRAIMFITVASTLGHSVTAVLLAWMGHGFMSLAWASICSTLVTIAGAIIAQPDGVFIWPTLAERRHVLAFSMRSSLSSIAAEAGHSAPDMVLGRTVGMEGTGLFSRAIGYVQLFERLLQDVLRSVMLPYFSEEVRSGGSVRKKTFLALQNVVSISWFIIALSAILAEPLIALLYGRQWMAAVPLAQVLCIAMAARCIAPTLASALVAKGQIRLVMRITVFSTAAKFICLMLASTYGLVNGAWGFVLAESFGMVLIIYYSSQAQLFSFADHGRIVLSCLPATVVGIQPAVAFTIYGPEITASLMNTMLLGGIGFLSICVWLAALWIMNQPPKQELQRLLIAIRKR